MRKKEVLIKMIKWYHKVSEQDAVAFKNGLIDLIVKIKNVDIVAQKENF